MNTSNINIKLLFFLVIIHTMSMALPPMVLFSTGSYSGFLMWIPSLLLTNTTWSLIHEGIHNNLSSAPKKNLLYSRLVSIIFHINFETLKFGHMQHHRYNRTDYDLTDGYDASLKKTYSKIQYYGYKTRKNLVYYTHISFGMYLFEIMGPLLLFLPAKMVLKVAKKILGNEHPYLKNGQILLVKPDRLKNIRVDNLINIIMFSMVLICYNDHVWLYLLYLSIRGLLISSTDNLPHYGASLDNINGAFNLKAPKLWQKLILNFNYHRVHHRYPNLPWYLLPRRYQETQDYFDTNYFKNYFKQWRGLIDKEKLRKTTTS